MTCILALLMTLQSQGFDPDGYYFPQPEVKIGKCEIQSFGLDIVYSPSHSNAPPSASLHIKSIGRENLSVVFTTNVVVTVDTLVLKFETKQLGVVRISGTFLDKRGSFADRSDVDDEKTIVLRARVVVEDKGREVYSGIHQFTYFAGD